MSAAEILDELPKLSPEEIDIIFFRAADLRQHVLAASPELLAAIDEADESFEKEGGIPIAEVETTIKSWPTK
jgi:hypothetical protein